MSIRSKWCDYNKETRKYILKRDDNKCLICKKKGALTIAHIFISRAKGGKGCKENGVTLCSKCHYYYVDNPIGEENNKKAKIYLEELKKYLIEKEHINYNKEFLDSLRFSKDKILKENKTIENKPKNDEKCIQCIYCIKVSNSNSTIPTYYCSLYSNRVNKKQKSCKKYKNEI